MDEKLQEALWRACSVLEVDSRSPGEDAHHLTVGFQFTRTMFLVVAMGCAGRVVEGIVGQENNYAMCDAIVQENRNTFHWQTASDFCSLTPEQVLHLAQISVSRMPEKQPKFSYTRKEAQTKKTFDRLCKILQLQPRDVSSPSSVSETSSASES